MFSVPDGRAANQPLAVDDLQAADRRVVAGRAVSLAVIGSPASVGRRDRFGRELLQRAFCSGVAGASMRV